MLAADDPAGYVFYNERCFQPKAPNDSGKAITDHTIESRAITASGDEVTCVPNHVYIIIEEKRHPLVHNLTESKTMKPLRDASCQLQQECGYALDDTCYYARRDDRIVYIGRCCLGVLLSPSGICVYGAQSNILRNNNNNNKIGTTWAPLAMANFDEQKLFCSILYALVISIPDIHNAAFILDGVEDIRPAANIHAVPPAQ